MNTWILAGAGVIGGFWALVGYSVGRRERRRARVELAQALSAPRAPDVSAAAPEAADIQAAPETPTEVLHIDELFVIEEARGGTTPLEEDVDEVRTRMYRPSQLMRECELQPLPSARSAQS